MRAIYFYLLEVESVNVILLKGALLLQLHHDNTKKPVNPKGRRKGTMYIHVYINAVSILYTYIPGLGARFESNTHNCVLTSNAVVYANVSICELIYTTLLNLHRKYTHPFAWVVLLQIITECGKSILSKINRVE